ncbi:ABC transporter ATP-binding protein [Frankia sp. CNm7]|uniref:ABC transporter ATP-binding protein n=1 Tax=Frankia nepalensis TaxID=1836974 RepID=A0A937RJ92_9ACTN|nr:ABC transporter ATP-binding protein [Frankia nepalensis]MBL7498880.1 ABC transporter ATP-binding protein [Frankia nepalensis]MBL7512555.1 ABC transporter ATP-binding protein [Frankia nepalensis]MBL7519897.1 ABC transporter ATP-binding protein [Frankia nepalensis]MBL7631340.1 ABC transporter ATP-binding protein [Frankia nepalensis]
MTTLAAALAASDGRAAGPTADEAGAPAVRVRGVRREFAGRAVLAGIDLDIAPGEFVALLGRSGSGKSTLLRILAGLDPDATGHATVPDRNAVVFQDPRLLPWARVLDNVALGLKGKGARAAAGAALAEVGLGGHERAWPATLSGGEAQRAALARALVRSPGLLLLDEPFGALDALTRIRMHTLLRDLCRRHRPAVLLVTHDVDEAILLADRVLVLTDGRLSLDEPVRLAEARHRSDREFGALRARLLAELGVTDDETDGETGEEMSIETDVGAE